MTGYLRYAAADLMSLLAAIAKSPIVVDSTIVVDSPIGVDTAAVTPGGCFADWCASRQTADIDAEILAWIVSHAGAHPRAARGLH